MVIFKRLKNVPKKVEKRKDCFVGVCSGGSMTPELKMKWARHVFAKRPSAAVFREPVIHIEDCHYSHLAEPVIKAMKDVCFTDMFFTPKFIH